MVNKNLPPVGWESAANTSPAHRRKLTPPPMALQAHDVMLSLMRGQALLRGAAAAQAGDAGTTAAVQAQLLGAQTDPQLLLSRSPHVSWLAGACAAVPSCAMPGVSQRAAHTTYFSPLAQKAPLSTHACCHDTFNPRSLPRSTPRLSLRSTQPSSA